MTGPLVNAAVILVCALAGRFLVRGIPARVEAIVKKAIGLAVVYAGFKGALESERFLLLIMSMVAGAVIGELLDIDALMNRLGALAARIMPKMASAAGTADTESAAAVFSRGFVAASVLFCSGSMAVVGSMQSGLRGNHEMLFAKSILDGSIALVFGASLGIGVAFSCLPVLVYQGGIALLARLVSGALDEAAIREMSAVGSLVMAAIGLNFLEIKEIKVANLVPAVFVPLVVIGVFG
jgi:uncharacterized membrane protein YqgA involved in biofilm formation